MESLYLLKYGELSLKGGNRKEFELHVCRDIKSKLPDLDFKLQRVWQRLYLRPATDCSEDRCRRKIEQALARTFGIVGFAKSYVTAKDIEEIEEAAALLTQSLIKQGGIRFKIEARRSDKSFAYSSYDIACTLGDRLRRRFPQLIVDLKHPDWLIQVEVRKKVYVYGPDIKSPGGLPLGSSGSGLLLLSGGIDSPVAGYLMAKRGLHIDAVYYHTPPYTSEQSVQKVQELARALSLFATGLRLFVVPFTDIQLAVNRYAKKGETTLLVRAAMIRIAEILARREDYDCLITGESLGQVASQTVSSMHFTGSNTNLPVFRPLVGLDKEDIIRLAREIGTYETSILPYEDCCTLFAPQHPVVRPDFRRMVHSFEALHLEELIDSAAQTAAAHDTRDDKYSV